MIKMAEQQRGSRDVGESQSHRVLQLYFFRLIKMRESDFQHDLIKEIQRRFTGCIVMKNDANYIQGIPDLTVLYKDKWAALECKIREKASKRKNQGYYVSKMADMSFASFIYPENMEAVLDEMGRYFNKEKD